jgi:hypothetical protein
MAERSVPIDIGGEKLHLRFERKDVREIERNHAPILMLLQPGRFGWDTAAIFLHKGLKRENEKGEFVYAIPQNAEGDIKAFDLVQEFTGKFRGISTGLAFLYGAINGAMIASGWYLSPEEEEKKPEDEGEVRTVDPSKNLATPSTPTAQ